MVKHHKKWTEAQIAEVLKASDAPGASIPDLCRVYGISLGSFYRWRARRDGTDPGSNRHLNDLENENRRLKELLAQRDLEIDAIQRVLRKNSPRHSSDGKP